MDKEEKKTWKISAFDLDLDLDTGSVLLCALCLDFPVTGECEGLVVYSSS